MPTNWTGYPTAVVILVIVAAFVKYKKSTINKAPLPPGPPQLPLIGNLLDVPSKDLERSYLNLNKKYGTSHRRCASKLCSYIHSCTIGEIVYLNAFGQPMVVLGTHEAALDLLEKRSSNYSDRLFSCMSEL